MIPESTSDTVVPTAGTNWIFPHTSQSPAVNVTPAHWVGVTLVIDVADALPAGYSPTLPPVELLPFVTPVIFGVVIVGELKVCPFSCEALIATLQLKPALVVHSRAELAPLQLGIANALGEALALDAFVTTVLPAILDSPERGTVAHPGADDAPVETIVCPLEEPAGFSS